MRTLDILAGDSRVVAWLILGCSSLAAVTSCAAPNLSAGGFVVDSDQLLAESVKEVAEDELRDISQRLGMSVYLVTQTADGPPDRVIAPIVDAANEAGQSVVVVTVDQHGVGGFTLSRIATERRTGEVKLVPRWDDLAPIDEGRIRQIIETTVNQFAIQ